jgi:hypothetical protein
MHLVVPPSTFASDDDDDDEDDVNFLYHNCYAFLCLTYYISLSFFNAAITILVDQVSYCWYFLYFGLREQSSKCLAINKYLS